MVKKTYTQIRRMGKCCINQWLPLSRPIGDQRHQSPHPGQVTPPFSPLWPVIWRSNQTKYKQNLVTSYCPGPDLHTIHSLFIHSLVQIDNVLISCKDRVFEGPQSTRNQVAFNAAQLDVLAVLRNVCKGIHILGCGRYVLLHTLCLC